MSTCVGKLSEDYVAVLFGTGYKRFESPCGIDGLAKVIPGTRLDLLAIDTFTPGKGQFREFIRLCKLEFNTICIWEVFNEWLPAVLLRYGFTPEIEIQGDGEKLEGFRWDK